MSVIVLVELQVKPDAVNEVKGLLKQMLRIRAPTPDVRRSISTATSRIRAIWCFMSGGNRATTINAISLGAPRLGPSINLARS
jgi:hypothetical protein